MATWRNQKIHAKQQQKARTLIVRGALLALTINLTPATTTPPVWNHPLPRAMYEMLSNCETGSNLAHITRSYVGAFGFSKAVWRRYSDTPIRKAKDMTYGQQAKVLDNAFFFGKRDKDGIKTWPIGPYGHGCWKHYWKTSPELRRAVCHNGKALVRRWCRKP